MELRRWRPKHDDDDVGMSDIWLVSGENTSAPVIAWASLKLEIKR